MIMVQRRETRWFRPARFHASSAPRSVDQNCYPPAMVRGTQVSNSIKTHFRKRSRMNFASRIQSWIRRTFTLYLSGKIALALLVLVVSAASITVTTKNYQSELGGAVNVNNKLTGVDKGFTKASIAGSALGTGTCATNVTFTITPATTATTTVTSGDYVYDIQIINTTQTPTATCYKVALTVTTSSGVQTTYGPLYIATTSTPSAWQPLDAKFDVQSTSLPASPFSFLIAITCQIGTCP